MLSFLLVGVFLSECGKGPDCVNGKCMYGDGAYFCQCRRGWAGAKCDVPQAGFREVIPKAVARTAAAPKAVNYACLVNGTECTDSKTCNYYAGAYSCDPCPEGFVLYDGECLPKKCFGTSDISDSAATKPPCSDRGRCELRDLGLSGLSADDYVCNCYPIYRGSLCDACDEANAVAPKAKEGALPECKPLACQDAEGVVCSGKGSCVLDVGADRASYHYRCNCVAGYTRIGHTCIKDECVTHIDGTPVPCGGFGKCTEKTGETGSYSCECDKDAVQVGTSCTYPTCTDTGKSKICGGVGACVRHGSGYRCDCRGLATGDQCGTCTESTAASVGGKCVPLGCLAEDKTDKCTSSNGKCVKTDGRYHCRCPDMLVAVNGECTSPACMDEELGKTCSGHGTCKVEDIQNIRCECNSGYTYVPPGRCILTTLIDSSNKVCSDHGRIVVGDDKSTMSCSCSSIYEGSKCETCSKTDAVEIGGECVAKKCIPAASALRSLANPDVCTSDGQYTVFGDSTNPFITCTPKDSKSNKVSAYNGTFLADPGCVRPSLVDRTRRFYCGFLQGVTEDIPNSVKCNPPTDKADLYTCTCPTNFVHVYYGSKSSSIPVCIHQDCRSGTNDFANRSWYGYCGGVGDCVQKNDKSGYECNCGTGATWDQSKNSCITDECKLSKDLAGPTAPEYCAAGSSSSLQCTVGRDQSWQCHCMNSYATYNKTCVLKSKNADPTTQRTSGFCGGPGAGKLDSTGSCACNAGFIKIGDICYSSDCLPVGANKYYNSRWLSVKNVCSGKGVCLYNQLTGKYGCECEKGYESFGGYCSHKGCMGKVIYEGKLSYVECKVYDSVTVGCIGSGSSYKCDCKTPYKPLNGLCVHQGCMNDQTYCGGDLLASCNKGSDGYYRCFCSEGYEMGELKSECIPSKCIYRRLETDRAVACSGAGTCTGGPQLKDKSCTCTGNGTQKTTLRDISGELRETCILKSCISGKDTNGLDIICGNLGYCGSSGCVCDTGFKKVGNTCVSPNCVIKTVDTTNGIVDSICGGEKIGTCEKSGTGSGPEAYSCKCKTAQSSTKDAAYEVVDGFCLPSSCIFEVTSSNPNAKAETKTKTMCGGKNLGSCVINLTDPSKSECQCGTSYNIVKLTNGKCMPRNCLSDLLPGSSTNEIVECSNKGTCQGSSATGYSCKCNDSYDSVVLPGYTYRCIPKVCITNSALCSNHGTCSLGDTSSSGKCTCWTGYNGDGCSTCASGYKESNSNCYLNNCPSDDNCSSTDNSIAGTCQLTNDKFICVCTGQNAVVDKTSKKCRKSKCAWTDTYENVEKICYGLGNCIETDGDEKCQCNSGATPINTNVCVYSNCMPNNSSSDPSTICNKRGVCIRGPDSNTGLCKCSSEYRTDKKSGQCYVKECFGAHESILVEVCDGGGTCDETSKKCNCSVSGFQSLSGQNGCVHSSCVSSDNKLCSGFGACSKVGNTYKCTCANGYTLVGQDCVPTRCLNGTSVCNGGGTCTGQGDSATCSCTTGWTALNSLCYPSGCVSKGAVCSGNGDCPLTAGSTCSCRSGYTSVLDELCISSQCVKNGADGAAQICGGNGSCMSANGAPPTCACNDGYQLVDQFVCGIASSRKTSTGTTVAIIVVVLLILLGVAGFLVWWFVVRPRKNRGVLRERAPRKTPAPPKGATKSSKQLVANTSMYASAPLLRQASFQNSSVQL